MSAAHLQLGEDVLVAREIAVWIAVVHHPVHLEVGDHFFHVFRDVERMRFARRFEDVAAFCRDPVVFEVAPFAFEHHAVHGGRVPVTAQHARFAHAQQ
jgi:hypothetical protein